MDLVFFIMLSECGVVLFVVLCNVSLIFRHVAVYIWFILKDFLIQSIIWASIL